MLSFSQRTPLHQSVLNGRLEVTRLLVKSKADVAARDRCFSPPPSHHLSLTICLAAVATLHSNGPSPTTKPTLLHTCAASARRHDAPLLQQDKFPKTSGLSSFTSLLWKAAVPRELWRGCSTLRAPKTQAVIRNANCQRWRLFCFTWLVPYKKNTRCQKYDIKSTN